MHILILLALALVGPPGDVITFRAEVFYTYCTGSPNGYCGPDSRIHIWETAELPAATVVLSPASMATPVFLASGWSRPEYDEEGNYLGERIDTLANGMYVRRLLPDMQTTIDGIQMSDGRLWLGPGNILALDE